MSRKSLSPVKIRRIWVNTNSQKDQVTVQFAQEIEPSVGNNPLVAAAQGINFGPSLVTALMSFAATKAEEFFGTTSADYSNLPFEEWPLPSAFENVVGEKLTINVLENLEQNPATPNQEPKVNPKTGEVLMIGDKPIYRHTELSTESRSSRVFLQHDTVKAAATTTTASASTKLEGVTL